MAVETREVATETRAAQPLATATATAHTPPPPLLLVDIAVILGLIGAAYALARVASLWSAPLETQVTIDLSAFALPSYAFASLVRIVAAWQRGRKPS